MQPDMSRFEERETDVGTYAPCGLRPTGTHPQEHIDDGPRSNAILRALWSIRAFISDTRFHVRREVQRVEYDDLPF